MRTSASRERLLTCSRVLRSVTFPRAAKPRVREDLAVRGARRRRYAKDGRRFHSMPEFGDTANFPSPADDLPRVALGTWKRFLMVGLAPAMTFDDVVAPMRARLGHLPFVT